MSIAFYISIKHSLDFKTHECPLFTNNIYFTTFWWIVSVRYTHNYNLSDGNANDKTRMRLIVIRFSLNCHPFCCLSNCQPNQTIIIFFRVVSTLASLPKTIILFSVHICVSSVLMSSCNALHLSVCSHVYLFSFNCWNDPAGRELKFIMSCHRLILCGNGPKSQHRNTAITKHTDIRLLIYWFWISFQHRN